MAEQGCLLSSCAGNPGAEGSNPSLSAARPRAVVNRSPSRRPLTATFCVSGAHANRQEASLDDGVLRNPGFGATNALAGSRREARPGLRLVG